MDAKLRSLADLTKEEFTSFMESFDTVLCDCDEVLWYHHMAITGSAAVINKLKELGKRTYFITNNSTKSREHLYMKFHRLGFNVQYDEILCSVYLAGLYLDSLKLARNKRVYVIGSKGLTQELDKLDVNYFGYGPDVLFSNVTTLVSSLRTGDKDVAAVVVGFDEYFSFPKMMKAASYLSDPSVHFVATNPDERSPILPNVVIPGTGSILSAIKTSSNRHPFVVGKPSTFVATVLAKQFVLDPKRSLMIGDKCTTDMLLGYRCGFQTLLVLTGFVTLQEVAEMKASMDNSNLPYLPDYYLNKLGDLMNLL